MGKQDRRPIRGRVISTRGRRVLVEDEAGVARVCFLAGQRAVVGDAVKLMPSGDDEGKLVSVEPRVRYLARSDYKGQEQVIAAGLGGLMVVTSATEPAYRPGLVDRYLMGASAAGIDAVVVLTKIDRGVPAEVEADLAARVADGIEVLRVSVPTGEGLDAVRAMFAARDEDGPWALVGHSGVGKTSLAAALLPGVDVGPIGEISSFWEAGRHTTTGSAIYKLPGGGELADSPGIRTFLPGGLTPVTVRDHFPGLPALACRYRDCLHRPGEDGCAAEAEVAADVLIRYRRVLDEVTHVDARSRP